MFIVYIIPKIIIKRLLIRYRNVDCVYYCKRIDYISQFPINGNLKLYKKLR